MIKLYRWHVDKHFQMTQIGSVSELGDIALPYEMDGKAHIPINGANISIESRSIDIKETTRFLIGFHPMQRNIYLIIDNTTRRDEIIYAELRHQYDHRLDVQLNPNNANRLSYFGEVIAEGLTNNCELVIQRFDDNVGIVLHLPPNWQSGIDLPLIDVVEFFEYDKTASLESEPTPHEVSHDIPAEVEEGTADINPETDMTAETEDSEEKAPKEDK